ncbi:hypothetical protein K438DRAFT_1179668 [Mycena galopus ATCC 62051]|nr:hypothetical protein K438DRAFT_1179668 [Mycena galopus ATCC 62051]
MELLRSPPRPLSLFRPFILPSRPPPFFLSPIRSLTSRTDTRHHARSRLDAHPARPPCILKGSSSRPPVYWNLAPGPIFHTASASHGCANARTGTRAIGISLRWRSPISPRMAPRGLCDLGGFGKCRTGRVAGMVKLSSRMVERLPSTLPRAPSKWVPSASTLRSVIHCLKPQLPFMVPVLPFIGSSHLVSFSTLRPLPMVAQAKREQSQSHAVEFDRRPRMARRGLRELRVFGKCWWTGGENVGAAGVLT